LERLSKELINFVSPFIVALFIKNKPIIMALTVPTVAEVIAREVASSHPYKLKDSRMAAAVPYPPTNPAPRISPNPAFISPQKGFKHNRAKSNPPPHITSIGN